MQLILDNQVYKKKRKILLWLISLKITKANWWVKFFKKVTGWLFDDCGIVTMKRKIKRISLEVIFNTKIFNIKFCSMKLPTTKILLNLQGDWTASNSELFFLKLRKIIVSKDLKFYLLWLKTLIIIQ